MKILTAIGNPIVKDELEKRGYNITNTDIQYKEGIIEYLEKNKVDCIILYEKLEGNENIKEIILKIKENINHIIVILETDNLIDFFKNKKILYIKKEQIKNIDNIIYFIKKIKHIKKYKINKNKYKFIKIKNKKKKIKLKTKKVKYKINKKRIVGIINLLNIENYKIKKLIKNKLIINIFIKNKKNIILQINNKKINIEIKNIKEIKKVLIYCKLKYINKKYIFIFINEEEMIKTLKNINKIIWIINNDINYLKININKIEKNKINKKILEILLINNNWKGVDFYIIKNIFKKYKIINKIKEI